METSSSPTFCIAPKPPDTLTSLVKPIVFMMLMAVRSDVMGQFVVSRRLKILGWLATGVMLLAVLAMFVTWGK